MYVILYNLPGFFIRISMYVLENTAYIYFKKHACQITGVNKLSIRMYGYMTLRLNYKIMYFSLPCFLLVPLFSFKCQYLNNRRSNKI